MSPAVLGLAASVLAVLGAAVFGEVASAAVAGLADVIAVSVQAVKVNKSDQTYAARGLVGSSGCMALFLAGKLISARVALVPARP
jgi:hypothetical protein